MTVLVCLGQTCFCPISYWLSLWIVTLQSVSAFAPICNPTECPWGNKAFKGYLGEDKATWEVRTKLQLSIYLRMHLTLIYTMIFENMIELSSNITWLLDGSWLFCIHCLPCLVSFGACLEVCWRFGWRIGCSSFKSNHYLGECTTILYANQPTKIIGTQLSLKTPIESKG